MFKIPFGRRARTTAIAGLAALAVASAFPLTSSVAGAESANPIVTITATPTTGLTNGEVISVNAHINSPGVVFSMQARLCKASAVYNNQFSYNPTEGGNCLLDPINAQSDNNVGPEFSEAPNTDIHLDFKAGVGTGSFVDDNGDPVSITCNHLNPCKLVLRLGVDGNVVPNGVEWQSVLLNYEAPVVTAPGAPTNVTGVAGNASVNVSWAAPASDGGAPVTAYNVVASPGGATCSTTGALTCKVNGLTNGTPYTFTVKATNSAGQGPASAASAPVTPIATTVPGAPTSVTAVAGKQQASVTWVAPASNGGSAITAYNVVAAPGGATCSTTGALTCAVPGLSAGTPYTFTVKATNAVGQGPASTASSAVTPWDGSGYHALTPVRILDSRLPSTGFSGKVSSAAPRDLQVTGLGGISNVPSTATAVVMNVTVAESTAESFLTLYPTGTTKPNASNLNFGAGQIIPNLVTVKLGTGGKVRVATAVGSTHVIGDVVGYYDDGTGPGDLFTGITPIRLLDSRTSTGGWSGALPAGAPRDLVVQKPGNANGVPATATAIIANVTVTGGSDQSFVSVWPSGVPQPNVSNLNLLPGQTIPNLVTVKIGTGGSIRIANAVGSVHVILDVVGYFDPTAGSRFHAMNPTRVLDTRFNNGLSGPVNQGQTRALAVAGAAGTGVPVGATGLVANVTVAEGTTESFASVFPGNVARPDPFSNLNFGANQVIPNLTAVGIAPNGTVNFYNHLGSTAMIADAVGYFATS